MSEETTRHAAREVVRKALTRTGLPYMGPMPHMEGEITDALAQATQQGRAQGLLEAKTAVLLSAQELCPCGGSESGSGCDVCDMYHDINRQLNRLAQAIQNKAEETNAD